MIKRQSQHPSLVRLVLLSGLAAVFLISATGAIAQEVDFQIVGFGEQDCFSGTDRLKASSAEPFDVEACVSDSGSPQSGVALVADISHADGTTEAIDLTTGSDGSVLFTVVPRDAGLTTVQMCLGSLAGNCDWGTIEFEADAPPMPPAVASYLGPNAGSDMGPSLPVVDGEDDFDDPYTGGPAEPGLGDPRMDIISFRYLGNEGGPAMFQATTRGDACELYEDESTPWWQFTFFVSTMDDAHYNVTYRMTEGDEYADAYSNGVNLDSAVSLYECMGNTVVVSATGVDVPLGSQMQVISWFSDDPLSSGLQDFADGFPEPVPVEVAATDTLDDVASETDSVVDSEAAVPISIDSEADGGSFPYWVLVLIGLFGAAGLFWWFQSRDRIASAVAAGASYATADSASTDLTADDLERYAQYGIDDHTAAQQAEELAAEKAADISTADSHAAATAAAIAKAGTPDLEPLPTIPNFSDLTITTSPAFAAVLEFLHVLEVETITGRGRDRIADVLVAVPDAWNAALDGKVEEIEVAKDGWSNIVDNPSSLGQLPGAVGDAVEKGVEFAGDYAEAAEDAANGNDAAFVDMNATLIASGQVEAVFGWAGSKFTGAVTRVAGGSTPSVSGGTPKVSGKTPDVPSNGTKPPTPAATPSTHQPLGTAPTAPDPLSGYRGSARTGGPVDGGGTPIQKAKNGCGAAVVRGIQNDMGVAPTTEIGILARGAQLRDSVNNRIWDPNGGINAPGMGVLLEDILPAGTNVTVRGLAGAQDAAADVGSWLLNNADGHVMVGLRWNGAGTGGAGHWVRLERVTNDWVHLGDPSLPAGTSIAIPTGGFNFLADAVVTVKP